MKKLLALVLVLGLVSVSQAGLVFSYAGGQIKAENLAPAETQQALWGLSSNGVMFGAPVISIPPAPTGGSVLGADTGIFGKAHDIVLDFNDFSAAPGTPLGLGVWASIPATGQGIVDVQLVNGDTGEPMGQVLQSFVVPEPMTLSLLALGGLGLIRRRR